MPRVAFVGAMVLALIAMPSASVQPPAEALQDQDPQLIVRASPSRIQAFGLESTDIFVEVDGRRNPEGLSVKVSTTAGHLAPEGVLQLNEQGVARTRLRAHGIGIATVTATGAGFREAEFARVEFQKPRVFIAAALVGALVGGLLRSNRRQRGPGRADAADAVLVGMMQGFGATLLYVGAINLIGWAPTEFTGAALVMGIALAAGWTDFGAPKRRK